MPPSWHHRCSTGVAAARVAQSPPPAALVRPCKSLLNIRSCDHETGGRARGVAGMNTVSCQAQMSLFPFMMTMPLYWGWRLHAAAAMGMGKDQLSVKPWRGLSIERVVRRSSTQDEKLTRWEMWRFLVTAQKQEKRTPPYHTPTWVVSCVYLAVVYPGWYLGWYPDYTWPYLGNIQSPVSYPQSPVSCGVSCGVSWSILGVSLPHLQVGRWS